MSSFVDHGIRRACRVVVPIPHSTSTRPLAASRLRRPHVRAAGRRRLGTRAFVPVRRRPFVSRPFHARASCSRVCVAAGSFSRGERDSPSDVAMADEFTVHLARRRDAANVSPLDDEPPFASVVPEHRSATSPWELLERWHREDGLLDDVREETHARPSFSLSRWHDAPDRSPVFPLEWTADAWRRFDPVRVAHRARASDPDARDPDVFRHPDVFRDPDVFRARRPAAFPDPTSWDTARAVAVGAVVVALRRRVLSLSTAPELLDDVLANDRWFRRHRADPAEATELCHAADDTRRRPETTGAAVLEETTGAAVLKGTHTHMRDDAVIDWGVATAAMRAVERARTMARALARIAAQPPAKPVGDPATASAARVAARSARDAALALGARLDEMATAGGSIRRGTGVPGEGREVEGGSDGSDGSDGRRTRARDGRRNAGAKAKAASIRRVALGDATNRVAVTSPGSPAMRSPRRARA